MENKLVDEKGYYHIYNSTKILGEGGQGRVYQTKNPRILIKLLADGNGKEVETGIKRVRALKIPKNCKVAKPILQLNIEKPNVSGYVMQMMDDMASISHLMDSSNKNLIKYYIESGGFKRRLLLLKKIAFTLSKLHSEGIVYGDLSDNNIFVSKNIENSEVWFIDCDNMAYSQDVKKVFFTRGYGAPEIEKRKSENTIETDIYAFAILAFRLLMLSEPFGGTILEKTNDLDSEEEDNWGDDEIDIEEQMYRGEVSWIGEGDPENQPAWGLSLMMDKLFNPMLKKMFNETLGINGRLNPKKRPRMKEWYLTLFDNYNEIITCSSCNTSFYHKNKCPKCSINKVEYLEINIVNILKANNSTKEFGKKKLVKDIILKKPINIEKGILIPCNFDDKDNDGIILSKRNNKYLIDNKLEQEIIIRYYIKNKLKEDILKKGKRPIEVTEFNDISIDLFIKNSMKGKRIEIKKVSN